MNTSGLTDEKHKASAKDLATLAHEAMKLPLFREVVATQQRGCTVAGAGGYKRNVLWKNTNELLGIEGYDGVKTGTTSAAGACLVSRGRRGDDSLIVVVLGSTSGDVRYVDSRNLFRWGWSQLAAQEKGAE
jgi:D-alanyl-D-alanine carboxypeptidase (penicillin-binding protein 5/6)